MGRETMNEIKCVNVNSCFVPLSSLSWPLFIYIYTSGHSIIITWSNHSSTALSLQCNNNLSCCSASAKSSSSQMKKNDFSLLLPEEQNVNNSGNRPSFTPSVHSTSQIPVNNSRSSFIRQRIFSTVVDLTVVKLNCDLLNVSEERVRTQHSKVL